MRTLLISLIISLTLIISACSDTEAGHAVTEPEGSSEQDTSGTAVWIPCKEQAPLPEIVVYDRVREEVPDLGSFLSYSDEVYASVPDKLKVSFNLKVGAAVCPRTITGQYTFDRKRGEITGFSYDNVTDDNTGTTLSDEEIRSTIDKNIDILIKNGSKHISEDAFTCERPEAFYEIVSLGRAALPYLNEIKDHDMESANDRWFVAVMAAFAIAPNDQDKTFSSPDGKYILHAFDGNTNTPAELTDYNLIVISDAETGKVLYEGKKMYRNIDVTWDAQRGYAVISHGFCGYSRDVDIIDIQGSVLLELPKVRDIRALAAAETGKENVDDYSRYVTRFTGFSENQAKFRFAFSAPVFHDRISGQYSFDIEENVITGFQATISEDISDWMIP